MRGSNPGRDRVAGTGSKEAPSPCGERASRFGAAPPPPNVGTGVRRSDSGEICSCLLGSAAGSLLGLEQSGFS